MAFSARASTWDVQWRIWRRLALPRSGDVEPNPGPPRARSRGGGEFLCVDISAEIVAMFRRAFDIFDIFLVVARAVCCVHMDSCSLSRLPRDTFWCCRNSGRCSALICSVCNFLGASFADSSLHLRVLWRLHKYWLLAVPSSLPFSFQSRDHALPFWDMDESSHRHLSLSTQIFRARRLWVPVCWS